ncbi:phage tail protein [Pseudoalteromonas arctica]|uniref:Microcystin-dependent protein n=1 Tax=Pseudoalteromonas arctica TaxID=394751 RepID=A0A7Y0HAU3_9GAMM|nr:tail fiber protein [Pseudoalteromonas arctica]NMM40910.1 microcystin-dependent protein [Pseudoalteromonas arctica]
MASDSFIGTMMPFGGTFAIRDWALCYGQLQAISENTALFSLLGDNYGGDSRTSFGLPDLRGRSPVGMGTMPGGMNYRLGWKEGREATSLSLDQLPTHTHGAAFSPSGSGSVSGVMHAATDGANTQVPSADTYLAANSSAGYYKQSGFAPAPSLTPISGLVVDGGSEGGTVTIDTAGSSRAVSIMSPFQVVNWQIALQGLYPSRS